MLSCFGVKPTKRPSKKKGGRLAHDKHEEAESRIIVPQFLSATSEQKPGTHALRATDSCAGHPDLAGHLSTTTDTTNTTQPAAGAAHRAAPGGATRANIPSSAMSAEELHMGAISGNEIAGDAKSSGTIADAQLSSSELAKGAQHSRTLTDRQRSSNSGADSGRSRNSVHGDALHCANLRAEGVQQCSILGGAQPSSTNPGVEGTHNSSSTLKVAQPSNASGEAQHPLTLAQPPQEPPSDSALADTSSRLDQVVSNVLASASIRHQEQHGACTTSSRQGAEPPPSPRSAPLPAQTACHTVTLASLEQAARNQAPDTPLALLVLGHQLSGGVECTSASDLHDTAMASGYDGVQSSHGVQLEERTVRGLSADSNVSDLPEESPSPLYKPSKHEMGSCVWLNSAFSKRLEAPSMQAALTTINQSISSNLTIQRHVAGFCRNVAVGKEDPVCFWSVLNPMLYAAQVEKICMWPCKLLGNKDDGTGQQDASYSVCSAILISIAEGVSKDVQHDVLLSQHVAYQLAPCMVTVLSTEGCILTQNAESVAWLGCHSKEHSLGLSQDAGGIIPLWMLRQHKEGPTVLGTQGGEPCKGRPTEGDSQGEACNEDWVPLRSKGNPCGPVQAFCYLKELFYEQEDLLLEMQEVLGEGEPFVERMEIRSPLLRVWMGAGEDEEVWHRVHIIRIVDPITRTPQYCLSQTDVTDVVYAERHVLQLQEQQSTLLKEILPQQVVEHLLMHRSDLVNCVPLQGSSPRAHPVPASPSAQTSPRKPPTSLPSRASIFCANPALMSVPAQSSYHKPPTPSASRGSLFSTNSVPLSLLGRASYRKPPAPSISRVSLSSQPRRSSAVEAQQALQFSETQLKPIGTAGLIHHSNSARCVFRTLKSMGQDELSPQSLVAGPQAPRSKSLDKASKSSPSDPSKVKDSPSLSQCPASMNETCIPLTSSAGQQCVGPDGGSLLPLKKSTQSSDQSPSGASILTPRASARERPSHQTLPPQDSGSGLIWLTQQDVMDLATFHDNVTILFCDIKGFTSMVNQLHPSQVMLFLNSLYSVWDSLLETFGVYKIETIGDCYMCCTGLFCYDEATGTKRLGGHDPQHARTMLEFAKAMIWSSQAIKTPLGDTVQVRVGIHSGPCSSGVVGQRMPRFCLFGDSVNTANRMESNGVPGCIHASEATVKLLDGEPWRSTGGIVAKGKGLMQTSLLPILPGAAQAAEASIAQRRLANDTTKTAGEGSSCLLSDSACREGSTRGGQLQLQHSMTGLRSSASGTSCCPEDSPGTGHAGEVPPRSSQSPFEALLEGQKDPTQHARPPLPDTESPVAPFEGQQHPSHHAGIHMPGSESSRMVPASAGAGALAAAATAAAGLPHRICLSCPGQAPADFPTALREKGPGSRPAQHISPQHSSAAQPVSLGTSLPSSPPTADRSPSYLSCMSSRDSGRLDPSMSPSVPCRSSLADGLGHTANGVGPRSLEAWPTFEQGHAAFAHMEASEHESPSLLQGQHVQSLGKGSMQHAALPTGPPEPKLAGLMAHLPAHMEASEHDSPSLLQGPWSTPGNTEHATRLMGSPEVAREPCILSESCAVDSGITLNPGIGSPTRAGESLELHAAGSAACIGSSNITLDPFRGSGGGRWVGGCSSSQWGVMQGSNGLECWEGRNEGAKASSEDGRAAERDAIAAKGDAAGKAGKQQQQQQSCTGSSSQHQNLPMHPIGRPSGNGGSGTASAEGPARLDVHLLSSLYTPSHMLPPHDRQQYQQQHGQQYALQQVHRQEGQQQHGQGQLSRQLQHAQPLCAFQQVLHHQQLQQQQQQQELQHGQGQLLQQQQQQQQQQQPIAQLEQRPVRRATADLGIIHQTPTTTSSLSYQGSGSLMSVGGGTALMRMTVSGRCSPKNSTFARSSSNLVPVDSSTGITQTMSDKCSKRGPTYTRSSSKLGRTQSKIEFAAAGNRSKKKNESSSIQRESSPAWYGRSKGAGDGEGLASVMGSCQKLVDSVTSRVLQQLQESRPESQARHAHPSDTWHSPWASRRSADLCTNHLRSSPSSFGRLGHAKLNRKSRGATGRRDRNASVSFDIPRPAPLPAFPRQISQPSPCAQVQTPQVGSPLRQCTDVSAKQPVPSDACS